MGETSTLTTIYRGRHLSMLARGDWEFVSRNTKRPVVGIVAITDTGDVVLVEQYRPPVGRTVIELPAGLAGDLPGSENEPLVEAAKRELMEETGFTAREWSELGSGCTSPGLTDESIVLYLARGLEKSGPGGGDESELITIHEIPMTEVTNWLKEHNHMANLKLSAGLYLAQSKLQPLNRR